MLSAFSSIASAASSHAEGENSVASGIASHSEGFQSKASGDHSHAEGWSSKATGYASHAEGKGYANGEPRYTTFNDRIKSAATESTMYQTLDHAPAASMYKKGMKLWKISDDGETWDDVLDQNITVTEVYGGDSAWFKFSKKLGIGNKTTRYVEVISGEVGVEGDYSHGEGIDPWTRNEGEHAEGKYNRSNSGTISSTGIGTGDEDRKNAFEILSNGLMFIYGVYGYDGTNINTNNADHGGNSVQAAMADMGFVIDGSLFGWE